MNRDEKLVTSDERRKIREHMLVEPEVFVTAVYSWNPSAMSKRLTRANADLIKYTTRRSSKDYPPT